MRIYLVFFVLLAHIIDDFVLQGILAKMKQKKWWEEQPSFESKYRFDFIPALIIHGMSWAIITALPVILLYGRVAAPLLFVSLPINATLHSVIDHAKANLKSINLCHDQFLHLIQLAVFVGLTYGLYGV